MKNFLKLIVALVFVFSAITLYSYYTKKASQPSSSTHTTANSSQAVNTQENARELVAISATDLSHAFREGQLHALEFQDKRVLLTGIMISAKKYIKQQYILKLQGISDIFSVQAIFPDTQQEQLEALSEGQEITMLCESMGEVLGLPTLHDCILK